MIRFKESFPTKIRCSLCQLNYHSSITLFQQPAGIQNPEIREDLSFSFGVLSIRTELLSVGCLLLKSGLKPFRLRFPIKSPSRRHLSRSGSLSKRSHLSVAVFLNSINPHLLKEDFREKTSYSRSYSRPSQALSPMSGN